MKNTNKRTPGQQALPINIAATVDEAPFLQDLVEQLAYRRTDLGYSRQAMPCGLLALETSTLEAHISGSMDMSTDGDVFRIPYTTCFMFTCTKAARLDEYNLAWISSLS